jgi:hypothetical protein
VSAALAGILYFLIPLALTVSVEALVGAAFRISKKEQVSLLLINIVTNLSVNLLLYGYRLFFSRGSVWAIAALEVAVVLAERLLLRALYRGERNWLVFSLACNAASFAAGLTLWLIQF